MTPYIMHNANDFGNALSHNIIYRTENERKNATIQKSDVRIIFLSCFKLTWSLDYACFLQMICDQISCCSRNSFYVHFMRIAIEWELWLLLLGNLKTYCDSMWKTHPILLRWYIMDFHKKTPSIQNQSDKIHAHEQIHIDFYAKSTTKANRYKHTLQNHIKMM